MMSSMLAEAFPLCGPSGDTHALYVSPVNSLVPRLNFGLSSGPSREGIDLCSFNRPEKEESHLAPFLGTPGRWTLLAPGHELSRGSRHSRRGRANPVCRVGGSEDGGTQYLSSHGLVEPGNGGLRERGRP